MNCVSFNTPLIFSSMPKLNKSTNLSDSLKKNLGDVSDSIGKSSEQNDAKSKFDRMVFNNSVDPISKMPGKEKDFLVRSNISRIKGHLESAKSSALYDVRVMEISREAVEHFSSLLEQFGDGEDIILVDKKELAFGLEDEITESMKVKRLLDSMANPDAPVETRAVVKRSSVEQALIKAQGDMDSIAKKGKVNALSAETKVYKSLINSIKNANPEYGAEVEDFLTSGMSLLTEGGLTVENFDAGIQLRIDAIDDYINQISLMEKDYSVRYTSYDQSPKNRKANLKSDLNVSMYLVESVNKYLNILNITS